MPREIGGPERRAGNGDRGFPVSTLKNTLAPTMSSKLFSREQIYIAGDYTAALKLWQKAVLRAGDDLTLMSLVQFSSQWFLVSISPNA